VQKDYISRKIYNYINDNTGLYSLEGYKSHEEVKQDFSKISNFLYQRKKENENFTIGIFLPKDYQYLMVLLASMYVGVTYVPLSKKLPATRVNQITEIAEIALIVTDNDLKLDADTIHLNDIFLGDNLVSIDFFYNKQSPLYIMFTSGSTGAPKGVMISRVNYQSFLIWMNNHYDLTSDDRLLFITEFTFDISLVDVGLLLEKNLNFYFSKFNGNVIDIMQELEQYKINIVSTVPSNFTMLLSSKIIKRFNIQPLKLLILSGSKITKKLYDLVLEYFPTTNFYNGYGPTEATIFITSKKFDKQTISFDFDSNNASVGCETSDMKIIILDQNKQQVKEGEIGEIFVSGSQLMIAYKNNNEKTKEALIDLNNTTYYRVGDLGYQKNGNLYIIGRIDDTIKTRGYRVNLSDIESYTHKLDYINESIILAIEDENIENKLYLFVTLHKQVEKEAIYADLKEILPDYQMPADIIILNKMPLNMSGKISKIDLQQALPK